MTHPPNYNNFGGFSPLVFLKSIARIAEQDNGIHIHVFI